MARASCSVAIVVSLLVGVGPPVGIAAEPAEWKAPTLPQGKLVATDTSPEFLAPAESLRPDVAIAKTAPTVDFLWYPGQDYPGKPWSNWGDSLAVGGKYYASIGDHLSLITSQGNAERNGNAFVYEYDPQQKTLRCVADLRKILKLPADHYAPGKIHGRLDMDDAGWLYFSTHRGSTQVTKKEFNYAGDWIVRVQPATGASEVLAHGAVPNHCIPNSVLDAKRRIFYGGTAPGTKDDGGVRFLAFDVDKRKVLYDGPNGPARYMMLASSTGKVYFVPGAEDGVGQVHRFDPTTGDAPTPIDAQIGLRSATQETKEGRIFTVCKGTKPGQARLFAFDVKSETVEELGDAEVASQNYITSIDVDPTGRYLYYIPGAHGGADRDGTPVVQYDVKKKQRKVIAFLHSFYHRAYGATLVGTFSSALDPAGDKLYITWNVNRLGGRVWDSCALTVLHIPASERPE